MCLYSVSFVACVVVFTGSYFLFVCQSRLFLKESKSHATLSFVVGCTNSASHVPIYSLLTWFSQAFPLTLRENADDGDAKRRSCSAVVSDRSDNAYGTLVARGKKALLTQALRHFNDYAGRCPQRSHSFR